MTKLLSSKVIRETEKAILVKFEIDKFTTRDVWFPKSQVEITEEFIAAKNWIIGKKAQELGVPAILLGFQAV